MKTSPITTHVLDTHLGRPAVGVPVSLFKKNGEVWQAVATGETNGDGRITDWLSGQSREAGIYKIVFDTDAYFNQQAITCFYPNVEITFRLTDVSAHYHVPLLISAHGMSTYRGS